jgi:hypothetical protein
MSDDIKNLVPRYKHDVERAEAAIKAGYPKVAPILPDLLEWLQDMNWTVAKPLAPFLASIGEPLIPHIRDILKTDDNIWKYWVLSYVVAESTELAKAFRPELERFVKSPSEDERAEGLNEIALEILERLNGEN